MPRKSNSSDTHRLNLELSKEQLSRLERVVEKSESASRCEAIRRALKLYEVVLDAEKNGAHIIIKKDEVETKIILT